MMEFRTKINIPKPEISITHKSRILMFGSCFIENIGGLLKENKFNANLNPFGILYNPQSIGHAIRVLIDNRLFKKDDIFEYGGLYHSFWHHSIFSDADKKKCLSGINDRIEIAAEDLRIADVLFVTFGTSYVFYSKDCRMVVGNCHKLPASEFERYRLDTASIVGEWNDLIREMKRINPRLQIVFTVSPIRHLRDGAHDNQLSKSILLLAIDELVRSNDNAHYFPSYEIMLDDLRDYRFYNEDMVHPGIAAIKYIWECFAGVYFNETTFRIMDEWRKIYQAINHKPFNEQSDDYKHFLRQTLLKLKAFGDKYPYICCSEEIQILETRL